MKHVSLLLWLVFCATAFAGDRPYNFIIINCDDLGYGDIGCYGAEDIRTPNIDSLARDGLCFTDFHSASSVCSPSRAALLTGRYPQRTGIFFVIDPRTESTERGILAGIPTIADVLKEKGYVTACVGKWHVGHRRGYLPTERGFDSFEGIPLSNDMPMPAEIVFAEDAILHGVTREQAYHAKAGMIPWMRNDKVVEFPIDQDDLTARCTRESLRFIESHRDEPFFLYLAHPMPHTPLAASEGFRGKSGRGLYGDAVQEIDWSVGQILKTLDRLGLTERTLVVFTSDNGPRLYPDRRAGSAGPYRGGKAGPYEGGHRVPTIMRLPSMITPGRTCDELATAMDMLPTFANLAGCQLPQNLDGHDITRLLRGGPDMATPYKTLLIEGSIRRGQWKLILQPNGMAELYNLGADPAESINLVDKLPEKVSALRALISDDLIRPPRLPISAQTDFQVPRTR
jgi:arylsulfatase A